MEERAQIPVPLPRANPTTSYWQDPPDVIADLRSTAHLPDKADVVIIGSGISGAAIAWNLLHPSGVGDDSNNDHSVVMLEARQACSGATGRNGKTFSPSPHTTQQSPCLSRRMVLSLCLLSVCLTAFSLCLRL